MGMFQSKSSACSESQILSRVAAYLASNAQVP
jgi:hypothetical protein